MRRLKDRVAIVTGAGGGVGEGVARAFAADGARVVIANRTEETGRAVARAIEEDFADCGAKALYVRTDVAQEESVRSLVESTVGAFGRVDVLVNNATPSGGMARLESMKQEAMEEHVHVNYYGAFWAMQAAFPHMKAGGWGRVVNMCSLNGINAHRYTTAYNASKEALRALTRTAAVEWAPYGITCNVLCPSAASPPWQAFERWDPERARQVLESVPMARMGDATSPATRSTRTAAATSTAWRGSSSCPNHERETRRQGRDRNWRRAGRGPRHRTRLRA
jgi:NAD(P)-dependent dehydrogenase (short-subunit alcohol dehydrogenase family)